MINLAGNRLSYGGHKTQRPFGFVTPMAPEPMSPESDSQSAKQVEEKGYIMSC